MSEDKDDQQDEKTEEPTQFRLDQAFEKGQVAFSKEIVHWLMLGAIALTAIIAAPFSARIFVNYFSIYVTSAGDYHLTNPSDSQSLLRQVLFDASKVVVPLSALFIVFAVGGGLLQTRLAIQKSALTPKLERISPLAGMKRIFSKKNLFDFIKGILKISCIAFGLYLFFASRLSHLDDWLVISYSEFLAVITRLVLQAVLIVISILALIAIVDYLYQKYELTKSLRMTPDEIKKEYKQNEGDPQIKQKIKQLGQQRMRKNMLGNVQKATAIITNPTHFAVAIQYDHETMPAPIVIAKGADFLALKIREIAEVNNIPIFENPPLARALYGSVDVEQQVPPEHYRAIAEIIRLVLRLKQRSFI